MAARFVLRTSGSQFRWNLFAGNNEKILHSERDTVEASAQNGISSVRVNAPEDGRFDRLTSSSEQPYFVLKAGNGEIIGTNEMQSSTTARSKGIEAVKSAAHGAPTADQAV